MKTYKLQYKPKNEPWTTLKNLFDEDYEFLSKNDAISVCKLYSSNPLYSSCIWDLIDSDGERTTIR